MAKPTPAKTAPKADPKPAAAAAAPAAAPAADTGAAKPAATAASESAAAMPEPEAVQNAAAVFRLDRAQALPEVSKGHKSKLVADGIQSFKDVDRRTMNVVLVGGELRKQEVSHE